MGGPGQPSPLGRVGRARKRGAARGRCGLVFSPLQTLLPGPWPRALRQVPGVKWLGFLFATYFNRNLAELIKLCISRQMLYTSLNRRRKLSLCVLTYEGRGVFGGFFEKQGQIVTVWVKATIEVLCINSTAFLPGWWQSKLKPLDILASGLLL